MGHLMKLSKFEFFSRNFEILTACSLSSSESETESAYITSNILSSSAEIYPTETQNNNSSNVFCSSNTIIIICDLNKEKQSKRTLRER